MIPLHAISDGRGLCFVVLVIGLCHMDPVRTRNPVLRGRRIVASSLGGELDGWRDSVAHCESLNQYLVAISIRWRLGYSVEMIHGGVIVRVLCFSATNTEVPRTRVNKARASATQEACLPKGSNAKYFK